MTHRRPRRPGAGVKRGGRHRPRLLRILMTALLLIPVVPGTALVSAPISIDGAFEDWAPVLADPDNIAPDIVGDSSNVNADVMLMAATDDNQDLLVYFRRAESGSAAPTYHLWIDRDANARLDGTDLWIEIGMTGANAYSDTTVFAYQPADATNGDPMPGDAGWPAGSQGAEVTVPASATDGVGEDAGVQLEIRLSWADALGLAAGSAIHIQGATELGSATDSTDVVSFVRRGVSVTPDGYSGAAAGATASYRHTIRNSGNVRATFDLAATSSNGWATTLVFAADGAPATSVELAPGESVEVTASVDVTATASDGTIDRMSVTATDRNAPVVGSATDVTTVGSILVIPSGNGSMAPGEWAAYRTTIANTMGQSRTVQLGATSSRGWTTEITDLAGASITQLTIGPGASTEVIVRVLVPVDTAFGTQDVTIAETVDIVQPSLSGRARHTTTCAMPIDVAPDNEGPAGADTVVTYTHTVTNSTDASRTVTLAWASSASWSGGVYDTDGVTPLTTVTLAPQGGSRTVTVRVHVPPGTAAGTVDASTITATDGSYSDSATDRTTVSRLITYSTAAYAAPRSVYSLGDTVYVRALGLGGERQVSMAFVAPGATLPAYTYGPADPDALGMLSCPYPLPVGGPAGTWTVRLLDAKGKEITSSTFEARYRALIASTAVSGGDAVNTPVVAATTVSNEGALAIAGSLTSRIWWDENGDSAFDSGDFAIGPDGSWQPFPASTPTHTYSMTVPAGAVYTEPAWSVSNTGFLRSGTYRITTEWTAGSLVVDRQTVTEYFVIGQPWITLTVSETSIDLGAIDPDVPYTYGGLHVNVNGNVPFDLLTSRGGTWQEIGLSATLGDQLSVPAGSREFIDNITVRAPWSTPAGAYSASIVYTVVVD